jgi:hypothetical protein
MGEIASDIRVAPQLAAASPPLCKQRPREGATRMDNNLERLIKEARDRSMDETSREEQRVNFAFGNASEGDQNSSKESVRAASQIMRQR